MKLNDNLQLGTITIANRPVGGTIGTAPTTVDICSAFQVNQTTGGQTLIFDTPTDTAGSYLISVTNGGSVPFDMYSTTIPASGGKGLFLFSGGSFSSISGSGGGGQVVRLVSITNGVLATAFANGQLLDGIALVTGDRILLKDQTTQTENGTYTVNATGAPTRLQTTSTSIQGQFVNVVAGTANGGKTFKNTNATAIVIGTTSITYNQFGSGVYPTIQQINTTGTITAWDSIVEIGATPLVANITLTLPTNAGQIGKDIILKRLDNTAFTVTLAPFAGDTLEVTSPTNLNSQFGALTITSVSATKAEQTSNIGLVSSSSDTIQTANAAGATAITSWNSVVLIPTLTANITLNYPTPVGNFGKTIKEVMIGTPNAFTITRTPAVGTITLTNNGSELTVANGALTVEAIDGTNIRQVSNIGTAPVLAEFGENLGIINSQSSVGTAIADIANASFTLPSAGTWEINYYIHYSNSAGGGNRPTFYVSDNSNNVVANGNSGPFQPTASFVNEASGMVRITTTGSAVYKMRWSNDGGSWTIINTTGATQGNYASKISWKKISGFSPVTGQSVDYSYGIMTSATVNTLNQAIPLTAPIAGNITTTANQINLLAGRTYRLTANLSADVGTGYGSLQWFNVTSGAFIGKPINVQAIANAGTGFTGTTIEVVVTPTVNSNLELRIQSVAGSLSTNFGSATGGSSYTVTQLGSSAYTTLNNFTGSNGVVAGIAGGVPAPAIADNVKFLKGDGTWAALATNRIILKSNGTTSGVLGGVTFTISTGDPWIITTSAVANGQTSSDILQYANNNSWDYWTTGNSGAGGNLKRGRTRSNNTSGPIGIINPSFNSIGGGQLDCNGNTYRITANSNGAFGICTIEQLN